MYFTTKYLLLSQSSVQILYNFFKSHYHRSTFRFFVIKYSKFTDNIGPGDFSDTFCQNTDKFQKGVEWGVTPLCTQ